MFYETSLIKSLQKNNLVQGKQTKYDKKYATNKLWEKRWITKAKPERFKWKKGTKYSVFYDDYFLQFRFQILD